MVISAEKCSDRDIAEAIAILEVRNEVSKNKKGSVESNGSTAIRNLDHARESLQTMVPQGN